MVDTLRSIWDQSTIINLNLANWSHLAPWQVHSICELFEISVKELREDHILWYIWYHWQLMRES
jgi:hypothetical protein